MDWWQAAVLGIVQGLTEFIPVSSTAHLRIVPALLGWRDPGAAFSAVIQLGTLAAVCAYFARDIARLVTAAVAWPLTRRAQWASDGRLAWAIAAGNLPIVVLGLAGKDFIETQARSLPLIAAMLALVGLALAGVERRAAMNRSMAQLRLRQVLVIGLFQALALIPGASRSGSTILGGLWIGLKREDAARFSFLLGIPAICGAGLFQLRELAQEIGTGGTLDWGGLTAGLITAAVTGYASIGFLLAYLRTRTTLVFVAYRLARAVLVGLLFALGGVR